MARIPLNILGACTAFVLTHSALAGDAKPSLTISDGEPASTRITAPLENGSLANWMRRIDGAQRLSALSIPGSHNSGAWHEHFPGTAQCQTWSLPEQLAMGVRFLDIRCRHLHNTFAIYHGSVDQHLTFDRVLQECLTFLRAHPHEAVIMSVKEEYEPGNNTRSFAETFEASIRTDRDRWFLGDSIPRLNDVRGKLVLLRRFKIPSGVQGIDAVKWADNSTFSILNSASSLAIQDRYIVPDVTAKWTAIQGLYREAAKSSRDVLYLNFTSGYQPGLFGVPNIRKVSDTIDPELRSFFSSAHTGRLGVSVMDFVTPEICQAICNANQ